jgi:hypothetical protein
MRFFDLASLEMSETHFVGVSVGLNRRMATNESIEDSFSTFPVFFAASMAESSAGMAAEALVDGSSGRSDWIAPIPGGFEEFELTRVSLCLSRARIETS